jgi:hypothetical protein
MPRELRTQPRRLRKARRIARKAAETREWLERRLGTETDPALVLQMRETLFDMMRVGALKPRGIAFQESRLPKSDGPSDCFFCDTMGGNQVPVSFQREFEDDLSRTGLGPEEVWGMQKYRSAPVGKGRGWVSVVRFKHASHVQLYRNWKERTGSSRN